MLSKDNETILLEMWGKGSREDLEKLFAMKAVIGNPDIVNNVMVFEKLAIALDGQIPSFEHVEYPTALQVINAVVRLRKSKIVPESEMVKKYIACVLFDDGFVIAPKPVAFVQKQLDALVSDHAKELFGGLTADDLVGHHGDDEFDPIVFQAQKHRAVKLMFGE